MRWQCVKQLDVGDLSCVRGLREIDLSSRGHPVHDAGINDGPIHLLQRCTAVESQAEELIDEEKEEFIEEEKEEVDDMMKDVPHLPGVTSLTIRDSPLNERALMTGVTCLLARCNSLRYFKLNMTSPIMDSTIAAGDQASISLPHLTEVEISGFRGRECEARLMERLHASATALNKITLRFDWLFTVESSREEHINSLPRIPFSEVGKWAAASRDFETFVWRPCVNKTEFCDGRSNIRLNIHGCTYFDTEVDSTIAAGDQASISLPHLTEVEISGFRGRECEARLMERLHASATALNKITLRFDWLFTVESSREEHINSLPRIPFSEVGKWAAASRDFETFVWRPCVNKTEFCGERKHG
uniref:FBD domain-containing protein n=1 Tax=Oryza meridionalis TaxID=40149 RepID=A0A0E0EV47_9ORYZ